MSPLSRTVTCQPAWYHANLSGGRLLLVQAGCFLRPKELGGPSFTTQVGMVPRRLAWYHSGWHGNTQVGMVPRRLAWYHAGQRSAHNPCIEKSA